MRERRAGLFSVSLRISQEVADLYSRPQNFDSRSPTELQKGALENMMRSPRNAFWSSQSHAPFFVVVIGHQTLINAAIG
jgi:hypothetical protein